MDIPNRSRRQVDLILLSCSNKRIACGSPAQTNESLVVFSKEETAAAEEFEGPREPTCEKEGFAVVAVAVAAPLGER